MKKFISVDGGGTSTKGVLFDEKGEILKEITRGFANPLVNYDKTLINIKNAVDCLIEKDIELIVLGIAGTKESFVKENLEKDLKNIYKQELILVTDLELAYYSCFKGEPFIFGIIGTGTAFLTVKDSIEMAAGWGHILGDYGSGYNISLETVKRAISLYESGDYYLSDKINEFFSLEEFGSIKNIVYNNPKDVLASLTPSIFKWIKNDNSIKRELETIIQKEIDRLVLQISTFYRKNFDGEKTVDIAFTGGVIKGSKEYFSKIKSILEETINVHVKLSEKNPIYGGFNLAKMQKEEKR